MVAVRDTTLTKKYLNGFRWSAITNSSTGIKMSKRLLGKGFLKSLCRVTLLLLLTACSTTIPRPTEDLTYLTPIPEATLSAFHRNASIDNKLNAVIAARIELASPPHFKPVGLVKTLYAEKSKLSDAYALIGSTGNYSAPDWVEDTVVWLVVFESDIQVTPPGEYTPNPPFHGCSYVLFASTGGTGGVVGGVDCAKFTVKQNK